MNIKKHTHTYKHNRHSYQTVFYFDKKEKERKKKPTANNINKHYYNTLYSLNESQS